MRIGLRNGKINAVVLKPKTSFLFKLLLPVCLRCRNALTLNFAFHRKLAEANRSATESRKRAYNPGTTSPNSRDSSLDNGNGQSYLNPTSKKQRVSHYKKPSPGRPGTAPSGGGASPMETETATVISPVPASSGISFGTTKLPTREPSPIVSGQDNQTKKQQRNSGTDLQDQSSVVEKIPQDNQYSKSNKTNHGNKISQEKHEKTTENNGNILLFLF